ncbi:hypothetical protein FC40_GL000744 [Ligilactobacillus hayakitensis DSM 18933 = JCM 14209]|uniref:Uncharacterized protein n=1 Tax=Ligilactobacillus hayakitensis DSM 18933 = JCM 14209 TaxID=1423755 RepID=A0A0R1WSX8_9LACO|nr:hypothetical protein [Ligilactobacillus hayakitensis]KRM18955.1 hypothetical protein FC40_GL000744 [Ligilactobacillus hayakitensis DSM 18933 = JCM 14209]
MNIEFVTLKSNVSLIFEQTSKSDNEVFGNAIYLYARQKNNSDIWEYPNYLGKNLPLFRLENISIRREANPLEKNMFKRISSGKEITTKQKEMLRKKFKK